MRGRRGSAMALCLSMVVREGHDFWSGLVPERYRPGVGNHDLEVGFWAGLASERYTPGVNIVINQEFTLKIFHSTHHTIW